MKKSKMMVEYFVSRSKRRSSDYKKWPLTIMGSYSPRNQQEQEIFSQEDGFFFHTVTEKDAKYKLREIFPKDEIVKISHDDLWATEFICLNHWVETYKRYHGIKGRIP